MMKKLSLLVALLAPTTGFSILYTDSDTHDVAILEAAMPGFIHEWNYGPIGGGEVITNITTRFFMQDLNGTGTPERYTVLIGAGGGTGGVEFKAIQITGNFVAAPGTTEISFSFDSSYTSSDGDWADLVSDASDGKLGFNFSAPNSGAQFGDNTFRLYSSSIEVYTQGRSVPDSGATVALLLTSLLGLAALARRRSR